MPPGRRDNMETLQTVWFLLIGVLLSGYAVLDGFDLGVGNLHLLARGDRERTTMLNAVGPYWDGNEVWLLTGGGAIFAAFPPVYATVFSGFYLALMLLLAALISRAVAIEFRNKVESEGWRKVWDIVFFVGSLLPSILLGVAFGNILKGIAVDASGEYIGGFFALLHPYPVLVGLLSLAMFTMQGALFLTVKTEGDLQTRAAGWASPAWTAFVALYVLATAATIFVAPHLFERYLANPVAWAAVVVTVGAMLYTRACLTRGSYKSAFVSSSVSIIGLIAVAALGMFPYLVRSTIDVNYSLTALNSSSSHKTLSVMLILALIGVPIVLAYTAYIYRAFRGKVVLHKESY